MDNRTAMLCKHSSIFQDIQSSVDSVMLLLAVVSAILNICIIHCARHILRRNSDTIHVYIANMTIADLILVLCLALESVDRLSPVLFPNGFLSVSACAILHFAGWLGWAASGLSLVLLNSDKLLYFCFPLQYKLVKSVRRATRLCLAIWSIAFGFLAYLWLSGMFIVSGPSKIVPRCNLSINPPKLHYYSLFVLAVCVLPILSSLVFSGYLFRLMRIKRRMHVPLSKSVSNGSASSEYVPTAPAFKNKMRSLVFIFATTGWTAFSLLPYRVFVLIQYNVLSPAYIHQHKCDSFVIWLSQLGWLLVYLLKLNSIVNPFITALIYHPYRSFFGEKLALNRKKSSTKSRNLSEEGCATEVTIPKLSMNACHKRPRIMITLIGRKDDKIDIKQ